MPIENSCTECQDCFYISECDFDPNIHELCFCAGSDESGSDESGSESGYY